MRNVTVLSFFMEKALRKEKRCGKEVRREMSRNTNPLGRGPGDVVGSVPGLDIFFGGMISYW